MVASTTFSGSLQNIIATRWTACEVREQIRMPLSTAAGARERQLVHGRRRHGVHVSRLRIAHGGADRVEGGASRVGGQLAGGELVLGRGAVEHRLAHVQHARIRGRLARNLGTDARGVRPP
jgi:hypothetical protein